MEPEISTPATPLFTLTVQSAEPIFKNWIKDVLKSSESVPNSEPEFYTRQDIKKLFHISLPTVDRYTQLGILKGKRIGHRILYSKESIQEALKNISSEKFKK